MREKMYLIGNNVNVGYLTIADIPKILGFRIKAYDIQKIEFKNAFKILNFDNNCSLVDIELIIDRKLNGKLIKNYPYTFKLKKEKIKTYLSVFRRNQKIEQVLSKEEVKTEKIKITYEFQN